MIKNQETEDRKMIKNQETEDVRGTTGCRDAQTEDRANVDSRMYETLDK